MREGYEGLGSEYETGTDKASSCPPVVERIGSWNPFK